MKKRIISFLLAVLLIASMTLTVSAESTTVTANYYQVPMMTTYSDYSQAELLVDMMVYPTRNEIYIKAEDLRDLAPGYKFSLSTDNCAFDNDERGHVVYYSFNAKKMLVYYDQNPVSYKMPYTAKYVDEVAWIPLDFGMKMLNIKYTIDADGAVCCVPYETVFSIAHYTGGNPDAIFCVAADGTGAYICSGMDGEYAFMPEFDLNDLSIWDAVEVIKQLYGLLYEEALKSYTQQG